MSFKEDLQFYKTSTKTNAEIAEIVGCSKRTVRREIGSEESRSAGRTDPIKAARILLLDIETSLMELYGWSLYQPEKYLDPKRIIKDWSILCWAAKWVFEPKTLHACVTTTESINRKDASIIGQLYQLFDEANIIIAHNARKFDIKKVNARFILNGFSPPSPYKVIDTLTQSRSVFAFSSHRLDELANLFGTSGKIKTDYDLWIRCAQGDYDALMEMDTYCQSDVRALEEVYVKLRPWMKNHPNLGLFQEGIDFVCRVCGNSEFEERGLYHTPLGMYKSYQCVTCGCHGRDRVNLLDKEVKDRMLFSPVY
jgi:hypothetical protein